MKNIDLAFLSIQSFLNYIPKKLFNFAKNFLICFQVLLKEWALSVNW